jgi:quercetin dioxygenase-like cupin family protein
VKTWALADIPTPDGTRSPIVLHSAEGEARAILVGLEPGQELGEHEVREGAFVSVVEGSVEIDGRAAAGPGTLAYFEPHERHSLRAPDGARLLLILAPWPAEGHFAPGERRPGS